MPHDPNVPIVRQPILLKGEIWKEIPNTEGRYEASNLGRVRSMVCANHRGVFVRKKPLICTPYQSGDYLLINLRLGGAYKCRQVGALILETHVGFAPTPEHECAHIDGDARHNAAGNLMWATPKMNAFHKRVHETVPLRERRMIDGEECFLCRTCDDWVPVTEFYANNNPASDCKKMSECKDCSDQRRNRNRRRSKPPAEHMEIAA